MAPSLPVAAGASLVIPLNDLTPKQVSELEALRREYLQKIEAVLGFRVLPDAFNVEPPNMNAGLNQNFRAGPGPVVPMPSPVMQQTPGIEQRTPINQGMRGADPASIARAPYTPINHNLATQEEIDAHKRGPATSRSELRKLMGSDSRKSVCGMKAAVRKVCIRHSLELATKYTAIDRDLLKKVEEEIFKELTPIYGWSRFTITKILMSMCQDTRRNHTAALKREAQAAAASQTPTRKSGPVDVQGQEDDDDEQDGDVDGVDNNKRKSNSTPNTSVKRRKPNTSFVIEIDGLGKHYIEAGGQAFSDLESFKDFIEEASGNIQLGDDDVLTYRALTSDPTVAATLAWRSIRTEEDFETMKDENSSGVTIRVIRASGKEDYAESDDDDDERNGGNPDGSRARRSTSVNSLLIRMLSEHVGNGNGQSPVSGGVPVNQQNVQLQQQQQNQQQAPQQLQTQQQQQQQHVQNQYGQPQYGGALQNQLQNVNTLQNVASLHHHQQQHSPHPQLQQQNVYAPTLQSQPQTLSPNQPPQPQSHNQQALAQQQQQAQAHNQQQPILSPEEEAAYLSQIGFPLQTGRGRKPRGYVEAKERALADIRVLIVQQRNISELDGSRYYVDPAMERITPVRQRKNL